MMRMQGRVCGRRGGRRRARGLSLVEILLCLGIGSMLLTALGVTFFASFNSYRDGLERGQLLNAGRTFLGTITRDTRMSDSHNAYDSDGTRCGVVQNQFVSGIMPGYPTSGLSAAGGSGVVGLQMVKTHSDTQDPAASVANPVTITYWFDAANQRVLATRQVGLTVGAPQVVCTYVQNFQVYLQPIYLPYDPSTGAPAAWALERAVFVVTLANRNANGQKIVAMAGQKLQLVMTDAAMPRHGFLTH